MALDNQFKNTKNQLDFMNHNQSSSIIERPDQQEDSFESVRSDARSLDFKS